MAGFLDAGSTPFGSLSGGAGNALGQQIEAGSRNNMVEEHGRRITDLIRLLGDYRPEYIQVYNQDASALQRIRVLAVQSGPGDPVEDAVHPWKVAVRPDPGNPSRLQAKVAPGELLRDRIPDNSLTVTGLDEWFPIASTGTELIWIEMEISHLEATSAEITTLSGGGTFDTSAPYWTDNAIIEDDGETPPAQALARVLIAELTDGEMTRQALRTDQYMKLACYNGRPGLYANAI
jgi:hypothetical protein